MIAKYIHEKKNTVSTSYFLIEVYIYSNWALEKEWKTVCQSEKDTELQEFSISHSLNIV